MLIDPQTWGELFEGVYEINSAKDHEDFVYNLRENTALQRISE